MGGRANRWRPWLAVAVAGGATVTLLLPWWNRFLGVTLDGYFPYYGARIAAGAAPYRDFFLHLPPLQALAHAGLESAFGRHLVLGRAAGALARVALAASLTAWLARRFRAGTAIVAALVSVWLASGDDTDILDLYNHHALLAAVLAGWAACRALDGAERSGRAWVLSGLAAGASFWTKQTIGLAITLAIPLALGFLAVRDAAVRSGLGRQLSRYALGWGGPAALLGGWLAAIGALGPFLRQVFVDSAASKGSLATLLLRPWLDPFAIPGLVVPACVGLAGALAFAFAIAGAPGGRSLDGWSLRAGALFALVLLVAGHLLQGWESLTPDRLRLVQRSGVFLALFGILVPTATLAATAVRRRLEVAERETLVLAFVGAATGAALALSWPAGEAIALPALAVVTALALDASALGPARRVAGGAVALLASVAALAVLPLKSVVPFDFLRWREPGIERSRTTSELRELAGLQLSWSTRNVIERVVRAVRAWSSEGEPVLTFPALPLVNWLADRPAATFAAVQWVDVTPDRITRSDLERILAAPPAVVVRMHLDKRFLETNESYFRATGASAAREFQDRLIALLDGRYELVERTADGGVHRPAMEVWVRRDRFERGPITAR